MSDPNTASVQDTQPDMTQLRSQFEGESPKKQLSLIPELANQGEEGLGILMDFLRENQSQPPNLVTGKAYQQLYQAKTPTTEAFLQTHFPKGVVPLNSAATIDYLPLQQLLVEQDFQAADRLTLQKMCELAGDGAVQRKWLYFTEVENFPIADLQTLNNLWLIHSEGKFGFSVQREIWLSVGKDFSKLWSKIDWKTGNRWTRYPNEFQWDLSAPRGHLPLSNQLRGVRSFASLMSHPAWSKMA
ncbi:MAG: GUN4 N-terminal ARM-like repeat domain-containing protein [Cyanobacteriota bacterium]